MSGLEYTDGTYRSPARSIPLRARLFPALSLYIPFLRVVLKASRLARKGRFDDTELSRRTLECLRILERVGITVEVTGLDHFRELDSPCVVIANHMSALETVVLPIVMQPLHPMTFIIKQSLLTYPVFGPIMRSLDPVAVTRTNPRRDLKEVLEQGTSRLRRGVSLVVFPQTTRMVAFDPSKFSSIGVKLAHRAGVPVIPLALLTDAWGNGKRFKDFGPVDTNKDVRFAFGAPITVQSRGSEEQKEIVRFIRAHLGEWADARQQRGQRRPPVEPEA